MVDEVERRARMALTCVVEPGDLALRTRLSAETPGELWRSLQRPGEDTAWTRRARALDLRPVELLARRAGLRFVVPGDAEWPPCLDGLAVGEPVQGSGGTPLGLWVRGDHPLADLVADAVAVVGSRASTAYGDRVAAELGAGLAASGTTVVSGGAYGIDAAAHRGALAGEGPTVAVLAGGLDELYPRAHVNLLGAVAERGALVSEIAPGEHPTRRRFLTRNRLIAALSAGTVVVEAGARSGARNTVTWATTLGRHVMAVPGPVSSSTSYTPHRLIRDGEAVLVTGVDEVLELVRPMGEVLVDRPEQPRLLDGLDGDQAAAYEALPRRGSRDTGDLALRAGLTVPRTLIALEGLRREGLVAPAPDGGWKLGPVQDRPLRPGGEGTVSGRAASPQTRPTQ